MIKDIENVVAFNTTKEYQENEENEQIEEYDKTEKKDQSEENKIIRKNQILLSEEELQKIKEKRIGK